MLRARIVTAAILASLLLLALFQLPVVALSVILGLVVLFAGWEWSGMVWRALPLARILFLVVITLSAIVLYLVPWLQQPVIWLAVAWWLLVLAELWRYEQGVQASPSGSVYGVIAGWLTLVPAWLAVVTLLAVDARHPWLLLSLLLVIWSADIGAYFSGRVWGRHRLAALLSPGKTLEGVGGGLVAALLTAYLLGVILWHHAGVALVAWLALCTIAALFSIAGDLHESLQKRRAGVKDSGTLLPGHGGVFDRIDSLTAAAPLFLAGWLLLSP